MTSNGINDGKYAVVMGASSGIGMEMARILIAHGWHVGVAARRIERLQEIVALAPDRVTATQIDVTATDADESLYNLIDQLGGMNLYLHVSGVGKQNSDLTAEIELNTVNTNADGFCRMIGSAFRYFAQHDGGHIAAVTSIAGTRGMGAAPAYSATKAMQNNYIEALNQLAHIRHLNIHFTDIRPGFVATDFLRDCHFPMMMDVKPVAKAAVKAIYHRRRVHVIDSRWRIVTALWHLIPHSLWPHLRIK